MERRVRIGIAGGGFACSFSFHEHPDCIVVAVADPRPDRLHALRSQYRCDNAYPTLEEMLCDLRVEAVGIFTPAPEHAGHSIAALKTGKHVLSAVPAAFTLEQCAALVETVRATGLLYMMAETSYYRNETIQAREWFREGRFGELFHTEAEYWHEGLEPLMFTDGRPNWRHGFPPMHYPTHSTAFLIGVTGERLTHAHCIGWGDDSEIMKTNSYGNPYCNEVAFFRTDRGHSARMAVGWHLGHPEVERATWYGSQFSFIMGSPTGQPNAVS